MFKDTSSVVTTSHMYTATFSTRIDASCLRAVDQFGPGALVELLEAVLAFVLYSGQVVPEKDGDLPLGAVDDQSSTIPGLLLENRLLLALVVRFFPQKRPAHTAEGTTRMAPHAVPLSQLAQLGLGERCR